MANRFFNTGENIPEIIEPDSNDSHILGAYIIKMLRKDKKIKASPICVRFNSIFGNGDNNALKNRNRLFWHSTYCASDMAF
jgi:hypothetical protein